MPTNRSLYKMKIINYNSCSFCHMYVETLEHFFFECNIIRNIWLKLFEELDIKNKFDDISVNQENILLGYSHNSKFTSGINTFIVLVKYFIFSCKQQNKNVCYESVKNYLKYQCKIHKSIAKNADREWAFIDQWY